MLIESLYTLEDKNDSFASVRLSGAEHPIFKAHFPSQAILPGFMHFEIVASVFDIEITSIKKAKFLKLAFPDQLLKYEKNNNKFKVFCNDEEIASFSL